MIDPGALRPHYRRFLSDDKILLTGHSHQAWPDVAREGVLEAFDDAATHVDDKWEQAGVVADAVRSAVAESIGAQREEIALGQNTHELVARWLSALDLRSRPRIVSTGGEFHSLRRQLLRLGEAGVTVTWVAPQPYETLTERLARAMDQDAAGLVFSTVMFETSAVVPRLHLAIQAARACGAEVLLDTYHAFGVVPFELPRDVFATGGGYKYKQWGEGNCWLRVPASSTLRPIYTGWFSDFDSLETAQAGGRIGYGATPAARFAGSTYDPTSHYRARRVIRFFEQENMTAARLHALSQHQTGLLIDGLTGFTVCTPESRGGFVSVRLDDAAQVARALRTKGIMTDARGAMLRLGPAPYTTDGELTAALAALRALTR